MYHLFIKNEFGTDSRYHLITASAKEGKLLLLLDGLDEMAPRQRQRLEKWLTPTGDKYKQGDHVVVIKVGKQTGKTAVVDHANWNGLVKVTMDQQRGSAAVKSYKPGELKLLTPTAPSSGAHGQSGWTRRMVVTSRFTDLSGAPWSEWPAFCVAPFSVAMQMSLAETTLGRSHARLAVVKRRLRHEFAVAARNPLMLTLLVRVLQGQ